MLPGHVGTGQGTTDNNGEGVASASGAAPNFLDLSVPAPNNDPELPLREAVIALLALAGFLALMAWAAMQWL